MVDRIPPSVRIVTAVWYRREDYPLIKQIMADRDRLPVTYDLWEKQAEELESHLLGRGFDVMRVELDPQEFRSWCVLRGLRLDVDSRQTFATEKGVRSTRN